MHQYSLNSILDLSIYAGEELVGSGEINISSILKSPKSAHSLHVDVSRKGVVAGTVQLIITFKPSASAVKVPPSPTMKESNSPASTIDYISVVPAAASSSTDDPATTTDYISVVPEPIDDPATTTDFAPTVMEPTTDYSPSAPAATSLSTDNPEATSDPVPEPTSTTDIPEPKTDYAPHLLAETSSFTDNPASADVPEPTTDYAPSVPVQTSSSTDYPAVPEKDSPSAPNATLDYPAVPAKDSPYLPVTTSSSVTDNLAAKTNYAPYLPEPSTAYSPYVPDPSTSTTYSPYPNQSHSVPAATTNYSPYVNVTPTTNYSPYDPAPTANYSPYQPAPTASYSPYDPVPSASYSPYVPEPSTNYSPYNPAPSANYAPYDPVPAANYSSYNSGATSNYSPYAVTPAATNSHYVPEPLTMYSSYVPQSSAVPLAPHTGQTSVPPAPPTKQSTFPFASTTEQTEVPPAYTFHFESRQQDHDIELEPMLLLDTTGSMNWPITSLTQHQGTRKDLIQSAISTLVSSLAEHDAQAENEEEGGGLRTVTFSNGRGVDIGDLNPTNLSLKWSQIRWRGATEIVPGWRKIMEVYQEEFGERPKEDQPLLMCLCITDGAASDLPEFETTLQNDTSSRVAIALIGDDNEAQVAYDGFRAVSERNPRVQVVRFQNVESASFIASSLLSLVQ